MTLEEDRELLTEVLEKDDLSDDLHAIFEDMLSRLDRYKAPLSAKQRAWASAVLRGERYSPEPEYENLVSSGRVPRGREVPPLPVLTNLPKKPPGR